jgi:hypothetical protein
MGVGEVVGGFVAPTVGGRAADLTTLAAPFQLSIACAFVASILCLFLRETAPVKTGAAVAQSVPTTVVQ